MSTDRLRAANRANSQHSTGPVTERGRAAVRSNALTHGFYARAENVFSQDPATHLALLDDYLADYRPVGAAEAELLQRIVRDVAKMRRLEAAEVAYLSELVARSEDSVHANTTDPMARFALALQEGITETFYGIKGPAPLERFESLTHRLRRAVDKSTQLLCQLQSDRLVSARFLAADTSNPPAPPLLSVIRDLPTQPRPEVEPPLELEPQTGTEPQPGMEPRPEGADASSGTDVAPTPVPTLGPQPEETAAQHSCAADSQPPPSHATSAPPEPPSKTKSVKNVTPPSPTNHRPNPEIGFVPHKMKSRSTPPRKKPRKAA